MARSETAAKAADRWEFLTPDQAATLAKAAFTAELEVQETVIYDDRNRGPWTLALGNLRDGGGSEITPRRTPPAPAGP